MGGIIDLVTGKAAKKAAKKQAAATTAAANSQAASDAYAAQAAAQTQTTIADQNRASTAAAELLSKPLQSVDVNLSPTAESAGVDASGRRRTVRSQFMSSTPTSGIKL